MIRILLNLIAILFASGLFAQQTDSTIKELDAIEVKGLDLRTDLTQSPASISIIRQRDLNRFSNGTLVPVLNTVPGVRMEERSPGSYRLSIRGSLLRSPFGVRNIKIYWKDIPLTDAGGNTYINLLDLNSIGRIEVLKGPAGSIYGAGTGGVVSFSPVDLGDTAKKSAFFQYTTGSYNANNGAGAVQFNGKKGSLQVFQSFFHADGYRRNSQLNRTVTQIFAEWSISKKQQLETVWLYTDLGYRTPGGLTLTQFQFDPRQARPSTATLPSAEQQKAGIRNKTFLAGITHTLQLSDNWRQVSTVSFSQTKFTNPFIINYESRVESNLALRLKWVYSKIFSGNQLDYIVGMESISGHHQIDSSGNLGGVPSGTKATDAVKANHRFLFTQVQYNLKRKLILNGGISFNTFDYDLKRTQPVRYRIAPTFKPSLLPRISAIYPITKKQQVHLSVSKGYSSPTLSEIRPSAGGFYGDLQAEKGWNYEAGLRGSFFRSAFRYDITAFRFILNDAIVRQLNNQGAEYFVNAGKVAQNGLEVFLEGIFFQRSSGFMRSLRVMNSSSFSRFRFVQYVSGTNDFSGNALTGVPSSVINTGADLGFKAGFYLNVNLNYTSSLPLTDANDVYADDYRLLQARVGWRQIWGIRKLHTDIFLSGDNLLNQRFSLGNDINAFGRRFYNPAPMMNWTLGIKVAF